MVARVQQQGMPQGALDAVFASVVTVRILRYLCQAGGSHTGRAIAKAVAVSHTAVSRTLQHLAESELVDLRPVGRAVIGSFNRDHWLAAALAGLFRAEATYREQLASRLNKAMQPAPISVILFGSMARGEVRRASDIDILCIIAQAKDQEHLERGLHAAAADLRRTFGHPVNALVWSKRVLTQRYQAKDPLARNIVNSGEILYGAPMMDLLR